jgi:hypothetical protein
MSDQAALAEIERRIQIVEDNLGELVEQAAAYSGAADEEHSADRIAEQQAKLDALLKEHEALLRWACAIAVTSAGSGFTF